VGLAIIASSASSFDAARGAKVAEPMGRSRIHDRRWNQQKMASEELPLTTIFGRHGISSSTLAEPNLFMPYHQTLRLFFSGGVSNDYRLRNGRVEFRINEGEWRVLDESEIQLHFRLGTEVARWLRKNWVDANPHLR
jgi:hypothetical protein